MRALHQAPAILTALLAALGCESVRETADEAATDVQTTAPDVRVKSAPLTYVDDIQPIYQRWCADCHSGTTPDGCVGNTCFVDFYEALHYPARTCADWNKAECGLKRIKETANHGEFQLIGKDGKPVVLPWESIDAIQKWIDLGMPET